MNKNISKLISLATRLDELEMHEEADIIDSVSEKMTSDEDVMEDLLGFVSAEDARRLIEKANLIF